MLTQAQTITVRSPATGEPLGEIPVQSAAEVETAIGRAREAQMAWGRLSPKERARRLVSFRKAIAHAADELALLLAKENGKPRQEALFTEVLPLVDLCWYYGRRAPRLLKPQRIRLHLVVWRRSIVEYRPRGVVGIISPWNYPLSIPFGESVMALLAGNAVVLKPSEWTPLIARRVKELWDASGLDPDLLQVVYGDGSTGQAVIDRVDQVVFTGSVAVGKRVSARCGERMIPCTLELGGKGPAIVCADADLERTAHALVWGAFANSGQVCASVERVLAVESIYEPLVARCKQIIDTLRQADPTQFGVDLGAMTFPRQLEVVGAQIADAKAKGARILTGGAPQGHFHPPTLVADVRPDMAIAREESFGPVLAMLRVRDEEEALRLANDSTLGLNAYVFSRDLAKARRLARRIEAGTVMVNDVLSSYGMVETPWGGIKDSGLGRVHGDQALRDFCEPHHLNEPAMPWLGKELWWFPYRENLYRLGITAIRRLFG